MNIFYTIISLLVRCIQIILKHSLIINNLFKKNKKLKKIVHRNDQNIHRNDHIDKKKW